jgi:hypothetical protein
MIQEQSQLKSQIFTSVVNALARKWPTNSIKDHEDIATTAISLTDILYKKYNATTDNSLLTEEKQ